MAATALDITGILSNAQSAIATERQQAEQQLKQLQEGNHAVFLFSLSQELANNGKPTDTRRLAGLILKNALDAKEEKRKVCRANDRAADGSTLKLARGLPHAFGLHSCLHR